MEGRPLGIGDKGWIRARAVGGRKTDLRDISKADTKGYDDHWLCAVREREESGCLIWWLGRENQVDKYTMNWNNHIVLLNITHQLPDVPLFKLSPHLKGSIIFCFTQLWTLFIRHNKIRIFSPVFRDFPVGQAKELGIKYILHTVKAQIRFHCHKSS